MYFLGIDPGYHRLGYGIVQSVPKTNTLLPIDFGVIETNIRDSYPERLLFIDQEINQLLSQRKLTHTAVEQVFINKNVTTGNAVIEVRGILLLALAKHNVSVVSIAPNQMKKMITGHGFADKKQIQKIIAKFLSLDKVPQPDDVADALGLAFCAWLDHKNKKFKNKLEHL